MSDMRFFSEQESWAERDENGILVMKSKAQWNWEREDGSVVPVTEEIMNGVLTPKLKPTKND